jgi:hypothetical protein
MRRLAFLSVLVLAAACDAGDPTTGFVPRPLPASQLAVTVQPSNAAVLTAISPPVQVQVRNTAGQLVASSTLPVTMAITSGTGAPGAALSGQVVVNAVNGVATFNNLRISQPGTGYTLTATAPGLTSAVTTAFEITP